MIEVLLPSLPLLLTPAARQIIAFPHLGKELGLGLPQMEKRACPGCRATPTSPCLCAAAALGERIHARAADKGMSPLVYPLLHDFHSSSFSVCLEDLGPVCPGFFIEKTKKKKSRMVSKW